MNEDQYYVIADDVEKKLDEADSVAEKSNVRLSHTEVFNELRNRIKASQQYKHMIN